jgi:hypothetical protein
MWIVRVALKRPYTFVVAALQLLLITPFLLMRTPTDTSKCPIKPQSSERFPINHQLSPIN